MDITGDSSRLGKPVMKDLQNNASNIVLINAIQKADAYKQNTIHSTLYKQWFALSDKRDLQRLLGELKSIDYASKLAEKYTSLSRDCLKVLRASATRDKLVSLTFSLEMRRA